MKHAVCFCLQVLGDHELEPMSKSLLAAPHSMCELRALLCKTMITIADIIFKPVPHLQVVMYCIACGLLFYCHARMVSHSMQLQRLLIALSGKRETQQMYVVPAAPAVEMHASVGLQQHSNSCLLYSVRCCRVQHQGRWQKPDVTVSA
jgi:hypothetical protein